MASTSFIVSTDAVPSSSLRTAEEIGSTLPQANHTAGVLEDTADFFRDNDVFIEPKDVAFAVRELRLADIRDAGEREAALNRVLSERVRLEEEVGNDGAQETTWAEAILNVAAKDASDRAPYDSARQLWTDGRTDSTGSDGPKATTVMSEEARAIALTRGFEDAYQRLQVFRPTSLDEIEGLGAREGAAASLHASAASSLYRASGEWNAEFTVAYLQGSRAAFDEWLGAEAPTYDMAIQFGNYADQVKQRAVENGDYTVKAEEYLASRISAEILRGSTSIDLTQRYATDDQRSADARHLDAVENLRPLLELAQERGVSVTVGKAVANGNKESEVMAVAGKGFKA